MRQQTAVLPDMSPLLTSGDARIAKSRLRKPSRMLRLTVFNACSKSQCLVQHSISVSLVALAEASPSTLLASPLVAVGTPLWTPMPLFNDFEVTLMAWFRKRSSLNIMSNKFSAQFADTYAPAWPSNTKFLKMSILFKILNIKKYKTYQQKSSNRANLAGQSWHSGRPPSLGANLALNKPRSEGCCQCPPRFSSQYVVYRVWLPW